jgi:hypothetical protein
MTDDFIDGGGHRRADGQRRPRLFDVVRCSPIGGCDRPMPISRMALKGFGGRRIRARADVENIAEAPGGGPLLLKSKDRVSGEASLRRHNVPPKEGNR